MFFWKSKWILHEDLIVADFSRSSELELEVTRRITFREWTHVSRGQYINTVETNIENENIAKVKKYETNFCTFDFTNSQLFSDQHRHPALVIIIQRTKS